jgi:hypothetical protein
MQALESWWNGLLETTTRAGEFFENPRRVIRSFLVWANIISVYALIPWHQPKDLCLALAITVGTLIFAPRTIRSIIQTHVDNLYRAAKAVSFVGGTLVIVLFLFGAWTNSATCLKAGLLLGGCTLLGAGVLVLIAFGLTWLLEWQPLKDRIPTRTEPTIPTEETAEEEADELIKEEWLNTEGSR